MAQDFGKLIKQATNQMNRCMDVFAKQYELTGVQVSIIDYVGNHDAVLQRDIEAEFNIQRSTATVALQRMEQRGLITRHASAQDARQKVVTLTAKAHDLHQDIDQYIGQQQHALEAAFTPAQRADFLAVLQYFTKLNAVD